MPEKFSEFEISDFMNSKIFRFQVFKILMNSRLINNDLSMF